MSGSSELEVRFAHLLQPIRDLAQNWHIDIATELEDYLHELDSLTVHIDPSSSSLSSSSSPSSSPLPLNFAEAALLIQGSACVYSKKVEYLYSLLYATLDVVIDKAKKDGKKATSIDAQGEDGDALQEREAELLPLDDIAEAHNVDLDESSTRSYSVERRSTLMTRLPTSLSQRSSAQAGQDKSSGPRFRVSRTAAPLHLAQHPTPLLTPHLTSPVRSGCADQRLHCPLLRRSSPFPSAPLAHSYQAPRLILTASFAMCVWSALLLEGRDSLLLDSSLRRISADAPFGSPASVLREARSSLQPDPHSASPAASSPVLEIDFSEHADDIDAADDFAPFQDVVPMQHSIPSSSSPSPSSPSAIPASDSSATPGGKPAKAVRFASDGHLCDYRDVQRTSVASDPYALLDPFDSSHPTQPFKRGKTQRKYPPTAPTAGAGLFCDSAVYSLVHGEIENGNPRMPCHAEFAALFMRHTQAQRRLQRLKRKRELDDRRSSHTRAVAEDVEVGEEEEEQGEAFDPFPQPDPFDADEWDEPSSSSPSDPTPLPLALDADLSAAGRTFEELCKEHLDEYLRGADEYLQSSELTQRVREWQDKLEPILEEEDGHPSFDILEYGDRMLGSLEQHKVEEEEGRPGQISPQQAPAC